MRSYIFTPRERIILHRYLRGRRVEGVSQLLHRVRRNRNTLLSDIKLMLKVLRRLQE